MKEPNFILKTEERIAIDTDNAFNKMRKAVLVVAVILFVASLLLGDNLLGELSFMPKILLIFLVFGCLFGGKKELRNFPLEIHFYSDVLEIHRKEVHYSKGRVKREFHRFFLADKPQVTYDCRNRYLTIKGMAHGEWYLYKKDGSVCEKPDRVSDMKGICFFYVADNELDIVKVIEEYSPIKVNRINID